MSAVPRYLDIYLLSYLLTNPVSFKQNKLFINCKKTLI